MKAKYEGLGWQVRLRKKGNSYYLNLVKEVVLGNYLKKGQEMFYYLGDVDGRKVVVLYLDGKGRSDAEQIKVDNRTFLVRGK